jgi:ribosomal protein S17
MPSSKSQTIYAWKRSGLICDDYNALYETYKKTMECQHCKTEFTEKNCRCMDHDHETGLFRKIVCHRCNSNDTYLRFPNGFTEQDRKEYHQAYRRAYRQKNKQRISERDKQKIECECGSIVRRGDIARHNRTKRHSLYKLNNLV